MHFLNLQLLSFVYLLRMDAYKRPEKGKETASFQHFWKHEYISFILYCPRFSGVLDVEEE